MLAFFVSAGYPVNLPNKGGHTAPKAVATVSTATATSTTKFTSILGGNVSSDGGATVTSRGVCWGTSLNPTIAKLSNRLANGSGTGTFSATIAPLLPGVQYHVRAYAINSAGVAYGANVTFTTSAATANRGWYFSSSTGNDNTGNGTLATPYKTLIKLQDLITINNVTFQPGDSVLFKKGDVFANGHPGTSGFEYVSCSWIVDQVGGYTAPSGTAAKPIIITSYGVGAKPNFYFPTASFPIRGNSQIQHNIFEFAGVEYITIDGLNFIDTRWPATNHSDPAYTRSVFIFGEWPNGYNADPNVRRYATNHCEVKNCRFENVSFAFGSVGGSYNKFTYDTMINMMACTDTFGTHDIGAGAFDGVNGDYNDFSHNYIESSWGKSGRNSSGQGMLGVAFDIFDLKHSRIAYNTIIDVRHAMEIGNLDFGDSTSGAQYDTFAFNKCIGMYQFGYLHGGAGDPFTGNVHNISIWNNVLIENNSSRMSGPNFGYDRKGNGTNFNQFWFFGNKNLTNGYNVGYGNFTNGSNIVTGMTETGGMVVGTQSTGSQVAGYDNNSYLPESPMAWITAKTGTATNATLTLSQPATATASQQEIIFFPPWNMKGITWSMPPNISSSGYYNSWDNSNGSNKLTVQYSSDNTIWGRGFDTLIDMRNNIFYNTTGMQMIPSGFNRFKHSNNIYYVKGGFSYTGASGVITNLTRMGGALGTNEFSTTSNLFVDTTAALPENWNLNRAVSSPVSGTGIAISGFTTDFGGNILANPPSIGLYQSGPPVASVPVITTTTPYNITSTSVWSGGTVTSAGASAVISRAIIISKNPIVDTVNRVGGGKYNDFNFSIASFAFPLNGVPLDTNTLYHVRAFAVNSSGIGWGSDLTFTTLGPQPPVVTSITPTSGGYGTSVLIRGRNFLGMVSVELVTAVRASVLVTAITDTTINVTVNLSSTQYVNAPSGGMFIITTSQGVNTTSPLFIYTPPVTPCSFSYSGWGSCNSGRQARSYTTSPAGCTGVPPADSLSRACTTPTVSTFTYYQQYNSIYLVTNVAGTIQFQNTLGVIVSTIPYDSGASWISVAFLTPSGTYTGVTYGRSLTFNNGFYMSVTSTTRPTCSNTYNGIVNMSCGNGTGPYSWSINSTTSYTKTGTIVSWTGLKRGTYTFRVKEANNVVHTLTYKLAKVAGSTCLKFTLINESYTKL